MRQKRRRPGPLAAVHRPSENVDVPADDPELARDERQRQAASDLLEGMLGVIFGEDPGVGGSYAPRSTKRRRTKNDMERLREGIYETLAQDHPMTVRQCFYALTVQGLIPKTEAAYKGIVIRLLTQLRRSGEVPYSWISDNTRWMRKRRSYDGLQDFLEQTAQFYRRDLWAGADCYVEIWCEKDALAGVILEETAEYDVPLMVSRGFSSDTYLQSAAQAIAAQEKPAFIYHFGDHDPSGVWISKKTEEGLRHHAGPDAEITFERIAVTPEQIAEWSLPTRPTKREGNTHARTFKGESVELDAIPAPRLRELVKDCIERHINRNHLRTVTAAEDSERQLIESWARQIGGAA